MKHTFRKTAMAVSIALCGLANAQTETLLFDNQLEFTGLNDQTGYELRMRLPQGELKKLYINPSKTMTFEAMDFALNQFQDGIYKYELVPLNTTLQKTRTNLNVAENDNNQEFNVLSGTFTVLNGNTLINETEIIADQQILDDLIVDGSACIGQDCVNGENFGFDTLKLKENNLRIKFEDTSTSASFPSNDWQLTANDSANGGANKFSIDDVTSGRTPFTVEAAAPTNSLYVESDGDVGFGTNNPVTRAHLVKGDSPTLRLEQNGSSGWTPQTWDVAGNETNFFIRDSTNGSTLPFRIQPGAPTNSIFIGSNGDIGLGTNTPAVTLDVKGSDGNTQASVTESNGTRSERTMYKMVNNGNAAIEFENSANGSTWKISGGLTLTIKNSDDQIVFKLDQDGNLQIKGTLTENVAF